MLLTHLEEVLGVYTAGLTGHSHAHEGHGGAGCGVGRRHLHGVALRPHQMCRRPGGVGKGRVPLQFLDGFLVFLVGLYAGYAEGDNLHAPQIPPLGGKLLIQCIRQFHGVAGQGTVPDAHPADSGKGGLKGGQQLRAHLACQLLHLVVLADVAADVGVEQQGILQPDAVFPEALDADVHIDARPRVNYPEGDRAGGAVLVAGEFLGVEIVHPLVLGGLAAEGEALADVAEYLTDALSQAACKNAWLRGGVVDKFAGFGADLHHLALLHDEHTLAVRHGDERAGGDDVFIALIVAGTAGDFFLSLHRQNVRGECLAVKIFLPLVGHDPAGRACRCFHQSHI